MKLHLHHDVNADVLALDPVERIHAVRALKALADGDTSAYVIDTLEQAHVLLQLEGLKAMKVGDALTSPLRVIFDDRGDVIEVIAVGRRQRSQAFQTAHYRLHPPPMPERRLRTHSAADWQPTQELMT